MKMFTLLSIVPATTRVIATPEIYGNAVLQPGTVVITDEEGVEFVIQSKKLLNPQLDSNTFVQSFVPSEYIHVSEAKNAPVATLVADRTPSATVREMPDRNDPLRAHVDAVGKRLEQFIGSVTQQLATINERLAAMDKPKIVPAPPVPPVHTGPSSYSPLTSPKPLVEVPQAPVSNPAYNRLT